MAFESFPFWAREITGMIANGWRLYSYPLFDQQLEPLVRRVEALATKDAKGYRNTPAAKLLATIHRYVREIIPRDPSASEFRQGNTLGPDNRNWFRAKFHERYRLFFRFSSKDKVIIYAWINGEGTLRKSGSKTDPYAIFRAMLEAGDPPDSMNQLLLRASEIEDST